MFECLLACFLVALAMLDHRPGRHLLAAAGRLAAAAARRRSTLIAASALLPVLLRLLLLPLDPPPKPYDMEEFNHLLQAQTYALGRLANPLHPLAVMLQSYQVVEWPHLMSGRPPLPALFLVPFTALADAPFAGNLLAVALTAAAFAWMLRAWLPPRWAAIGAALAILNFCLFGYWMNSYWCPATTALGGALLLGLVPRIQCRPRRVHAAIAIAALALLAGTRPYEDAVYAAIIAAYLLVRLLREVPAARPARARTVLIRVGLPAALGLVAIVLAQLGYNQATTGNLRLMPYQIWRAAQEMVPTFLWQKIAPPPVFYNTSAALFARWELGVVAPLRQGGLAGAMLLFGRHGVTFRDQLGPFLLLPLLSWSNTVSPFRLPYGWIFAVLCMAVFALLYWAIAWPAAIIQAIVLAALVLRWRHAEERLPILLVLAGLAASSLPNFYMNVYLAAYAAPLLLLAVQGLRRLAASPPPAARSLAGFLLLGALLLPIAETAALALNTPLTGDQMSRFDRLYPSPHFAAEAILARQPGRHAIFLRTAGNAPIDPVWLDPVWNAADIDSARIVWLRDLDPAWTQAARQYYAGRTHWLMTLDNTGHFTLAPYPAASLPAAAPLAALPQPDRATALLLGARLR